MTTRKPSDDKNGGLDPAVTDTPAITDAYDASSSEAAKNIQYHKGLVKDLRAKLDKVSQGGPPHSVALHRKRKKLTVRERIKELMAPGEPWLDLAPLAALGMHNDEIPSAGIVTGAARIAGRWCMVVSVLSWLLRHWE